MKDLPILRELEVMIMGQRCQVQVYGGNGGKYFALTRFSETDAIISDGATIDEVLARHAGTLPMAVHSRQVRKRLALSDLLGGQ